MISTTTLFIWAGSNTVQNNFNISVRLSLAMTYMQKENSHLAGIQTGMCFCRHHLNLRLSSSKIEINSLIQYTCSLLCNPCILDQNPVLSAVDLYFKSNVSLLNVFVAIYLRAYFILVISVRIRLFYIFVV